jgi:glycosyltransferase involved in cell wall biosynthesis
MKRISFIIPMKNAGKYISRCLEAILAEMESGDEIIVVDNGSTDDSVSIAGRIKDVTMLHCPEHTIGYLRNYGASRSQGDILAFIDADCIISPGWRAKVINNLKSEGIAGVGARYEIPEDAVWIEKAWFSQKITKASPARYINSGNLAIKKDVFSHVGGFDEKLITGEDAELGWRLNGKGFVLIEDPEVECIHLGNPKTLKDFYRKQKWHALGMMGTFKHSFWDKPLLMTIAFIVSMSAFFVMLPWLLKKGRCLSGMFVFCGWVPCITAGYRAYQYRNIRYFLHLVVLYFVYFIARSRALIEIMKMK